jgi:hypothetical protein
MKLKLFLLLAITMFVTLGEAQQNKTRSQVFTFNDWRTVDKASPLWALNLWWQPQTVAIVTTPADLQIVGEIHCYNTGSDSYRVLLSTDDILLRISGVDGRDIAMKEPSVNNPLESPPSEGIFSVEGISIDGNAIKVPPRQTAVEVPPGKEIVYKLRLNWKKIGLLPGDIAPTLAALSAPTYRLMFLLGNADSKDDRRVLQSERVPFAAHLVKLNK